MRHPASAEFATGFRMALPDFVGYRMFRLNVLLHIQDQTEMPVITGGGNYAELEESLGAGNPWSGSRTGVLRTPQPGHRLGRRRDRTAGQRVSGTLRKLLAEHS